MPGEESRHRGQQQIEQPEKRARRSTTKPSTTSVVVKVSWRVGQNTLRSSTRDSSTNCQKLRPYCENANTRTPSSKPAEQRRPARPGFRAALEHVKRHDAADHEYDGGDQLGGVGGCRLPLDVCFASSFMFNRWQARRESNPQPAVLETAALPIELLACS